MRLNYLHLFRDEGGGLLFRETDVTVSVNRCSSSFVNNPKRPLRYACLIYEQDNAFVMQSLRFITSVHCLLLLYFLYAFHIYILA